MLYEVITPALGHDPQLDGAVPHVHQGLRRISRSPPELPRRLVVGDQLAPADGCQGEAHRLVEARRQPEDPVRQASAP